MNKNNVSIIYTVFSLFFVFSCSKQIKPKIQSYSDYSFLQNKSLVVLINTSNVKIEYLQHFSTQSQAEYTTQIKLIKQWIFEEAMGFENLYIQTFKTMLAKYNSNINVLFSTKHQMNNKKNIQNMLLMDVTMKVFVGHRGENANFTGKTGLTLQSKKHLYLNQLNYFFDENSSKIIQLKKYRNLFSIQLKKIMTKSIEYQILYLLNKIPYPKEKYLLSY